MSEKPTPKLTVDKPLPHKIGIQVVPVREPLNLFDRFKMHVWNFILPPHIRLSDWTDSDEEE